MPQPTHAADILLAHDRWATDRLLEACASLDDAALDRRFEMGTGSLRKTLVHLIDVVVGWHGGLTGMNPEPTPADASVAALTQLHHRSADAFAAWAASTNADGPTVAVRGNRKLTAPRDAFLCHVLTHGTHHRAQALNMLRHLGVTPLPPGSVMQWMLATGAGQLEMTAN